MEYCLFANSHPKPSSLNAVKPSSGCVTVTWDKVYGVSGYLVRSRVKGSTWGESPSGSTQLITSWTIARIEWEYQVAGRYGEVTSAYTGVVSAIARPTTPTPPQSIFTNPTATGVDVSWAGSAGANIYVVLVLDSDLIGAFLSRYATTGKSMKIIDLRPGHHYIVAVNAWSSVGEGIPNGARGVVPGYSIPDTPKNLQVVTVGPTTIHLQWCGSPGAAGYIPFVRNVNNASDVSKPGLVSDMEAVYDIAFLYPRLESAKSSCVIPAVTGMVGGPVNGAGCFSAKPGQVFLEMDPNTPAQGQVCVSGTGTLPIYNDLCSFTCNLGFCPDKVCSCSQRGNQVKLSVSVGGGCPAAGLDSSYVGLCNFACSQGYCPSKYCTKSTGKACSINPSIENPADRLQRLDTTYPGIYWAGAFPSGYDGDCTREQLSILEEATRVAHTMTDKRDPYDDAQPRTDDGAFHQYFLRDSLCQFRWSLHNRARYAQLYSEYPRKITNKDGMPPIKITP
ncbi:carbohydrate-binding module family 24 protein [Cadophora sp. DSE1049]|nr:carbohydrate-binding module family 24 protein [Cadophora sp. DSE1049]